jgi:hypothetical protein
MHRTQGMGLAPAPGDFFYYFALHKSLTPASERETDFFTGLDPTLAGLADLAPTAARLREGLQAVKNKVDEALRRFRSHDPLEIGRFLLDGLTRLREVRSALAPENLDPERHKALDYYLSHKIADFEEVTGQCLGLELEGLAAKARVIPGQNLRISARLWNQRSIPFERAVLRFSFPEDWGI